MALEQESELVGFDADGALEAVRELTDGLLSYAEFTGDQFTIMYLDDDVLDWYRDEDHLQEHYETVFGHLHMDFLERETYENTLLPNAGDVRALVTMMDQLTLLRLLSTGTEGLYLALRPDVEIQPIVQTVEPYL